MAQACCQLVLHSSTEQGATAKSSVALHCCLVTAHLYQQQISIGVFAVAQACCQPLFHSSTEQGAIAKSSLALHCCLVTAHLYQQQISLGVFAVCQACCQPLLHSSTEQGAMFQEPLQLYLQWPKPAVSLFCTAALSRGPKSSVALHCCWSLHTYTNSKSP